MDHDKLNNLAYALAAHTGFCSLDTPQSLAGAKLFTSPIRLGHAAGPTLEGQASGDIAILTANLYQQAPPGQTWAHQAIAPATLDTMTWLNLVGNLPTGYGTYNGIDIGPALTGVAPYGVALLPLYGQANLIVPTGATGLLRGLTFTCMLGGAGTVTEMMGVWARLGTLIASTPSIPLASVLEARSPLFLGAKPTTNCGLYINPQGTTGITNAVGALIDAPAAGTNRYTLWAGAPIPGTPRLRLDAGTPAANQTMLYLAEGVAPTLRRLQWKDYSSLVAGDRVCVLV